MNESHEDAPPRRGPQFGLGTLLFAVAAVAALLAAGQWFGWTLLYHLLLLADGLGAIAVTPLPIVVVALIHSPEVRSQIGSVFLLAGVMLLVHLAVVGISVEYLLRDSPLSDLYPHDGTMFWTLNFTVPAAATGLLNAVVFFRNTPRSPWYWTGIVWTACGCLALVWYGNYFFGDVLGVALAKVVWWW